MDDAFCAGALILAAVTIPAAVPQEAQAPEAPAAPEDRQAIMLDASLYSRGGLEVLGGGEAGPAAFA